MVKRVWLWPESSPLFCIVSGVQGSHSAGLNLQTPPCSQAHPNEITNVMVARRARVRVAAREGLERIIACQLVVDIAAPVLRTRCCGGSFRPRREPCPQGSDQKPLTKEPRLENGPVKLAKT